MQASQNPRCEVAPMKRFSRLLMFGGVLLAGGIATPPALHAQAKPAALKPATPEQIAFFEKSIRPVLAKECYACHSTTAEKLKGGLLLDTRDGIREGGDHGPA